ncbi:uracil-DNA glycosylase family protein [Flagellimonas halotolerans]|uniref:Uracil-DNA glycosylase family protein n=1 Tax=Flagellimonas halotolerans TaxID=3112164 RepID=A0ABU6IL26_9FLAO|nr:MULTISPECIES: uracil-DNA glycosylase family protein [unclassified Allomuricauda]MEC3963864.1 uracil-DNA glycosylase family protein [Muricauda sp. SYSU M86414]MEC4263734.1 uracil-DNA glycosylase family protein [Muricauda sp. SYSU M84420]
MDHLLSQIRNCSVCQEHLPLGPRPIVAAHPKSKIAIIGQAPGTRVHQTGVPWDDPSGKQLRKWLNVADEQFYDEQLFALVPMGFCYPGKGKSGDLPPRPECAPLWHKALVNQMPDLKLTILIGQYAQKYYLGNTMKRNLTETVNNYQEYLPDCFVLPHPSPRNRFWLSKNPWFGKDVLPDLKKRVSTSLIS